MTIAPDPVVEENPSGRRDEAGTAPGDRPFRPDIQGLRAVAVLLVVLYHAGAPGISGGYVGVDVFFVISGFVITGVLLRERGSSGRTSLLHFYGRRSRRIIPAATVVIIATVVLAYARVGLVVGTQTATDAKWAAVFLANFHFASTGTNYLTAQLPPSPLQNFWSLAVEEQFYLVFPTMFLLLAAIRSRWSLRARLLAGLVPVVVASFALSVVQTGSSPTVAYFSPFTRAWELALGALVAVSTAWLLNLPKGVSAALTWVGLACIAYGACAFGDTTAYPGSWVAVPVLGAALVIAGGTTAPRRAAESVLGLGPFQWFGKLSYSIYLWHWPLLIIAAEAAGKSSLPFHENIVWLLLALVASMVSFSVIENPVRHARLRRFGVWTPVGLGAVLIALSLIVATVEIDAHAAPAPTTSRTGATTSSVASSSAQVDQVVRAATSIEKVPADLTPALTAVSASWGGPPSSCWPGVGQSSIPACMFGDPKGTHTMVVYGDSHAGMWFQTLDFIATLAHWRLAYLGKGWCPADSLPYEDPPGFGHAGGEYATCDQWHRFSIDRIRSLQPDLVIVTQEDAEGPHGQSYSAAQWQQGLEKTISSIRAPGRRIVVLGNIPVLESNGPDCLARHTGDVQACSSPFLPFYASMDKAEQSAATDQGAQYVNVTPWFCSSSCTAVIGKYEVYLDQYHVTAAYALFLAGVLAAALPLPHASQLLRAPPRTSVVAPVDGATLSGTRFLDANASADATTVEFEVTGGSLAHRVVARAKKTLDGWIGGWNTRTVPDGTYTVQSVATSAGSSTTRSVGISVTVKN